jgi:hypothetical protein
MLIWWLSQVDYECVYTVLDYLHLPEWLRNQVISRCGRHGRGRLWVDEQFDVKEITWDNSKPLAAVAANCGGIVITKEAAHLVLSLPGFVTDLELNAFEDTQPLFNAGDRVVSRMSDGTQGAFGTVLRVLKGRGGQRFMYVVGLECELPESSLRSLKDER